MNDNEIIKAFEEWGKAIKDDYKRLKLFDAPMDCFEESHIDKFLMLSNALDLIKRQQAEKEALIAGQETMSKHIEEQQAEIERLKDDNKYLQDRRWKELCEVKIEAIKEFAERLKKLHQMPLITSSDIDDLVKEMLGDTENLIKPEYRDGDPDCPICPNCRTPLNEMEDCPCGQKIDWSGAE